MTDWVHKRAEKEFENEKSSVVRGSKADNILLDGYGRNRTTASSYNGEDIRSFYPITEILPGQKVRLRLINGAAGTSFIFSVDGHKIEIMANDLVPVKPIVVDSLLVAIGLLPCLLPLYVKADEKKPQVNATISSFAVLINLSLRATTGFALSPRMVATRSATESSTVLTARVRILLIPGQESYTMISPTPPILPFPVQSKTTSQITPAPV